jgi:hypothetical protein
MQKLARLSFVLLLLIASSTFAPPANALPCDDIFTTYYDCALNEVGWKEASCNGFWSSGTLSGAFKEVQTSPCTCGDYSDTWYQWNGTSWVALSGPPSPTC